MFGYIKTYTSELLVRENEYYRAVYCGLCRSLGKCTGTASRMTLNYDFVFAALLRLAVTGEGVKIKKRKCLMHPIKKRPMADTCPELDFCARIGILLVYHKNLDDISDERGAKKLRAKTLKALMRGMRRRARRELKEADSIIADGLAEIAAIEKDKLPSVDTPASRFGQILADLLCLGLDGTQSRIMSKIGYHLGRWLYIIDAADDYNDDIEKGRFNPFALLYENTPFDGTRRQNVFNALTSELIEIHSAFDLLDPSDDTREVFGIIDNILRLGMPHAAALALKIDLTNIT